MQHQRYYNIQMIKLNSTLTSFWIYISSRECQKGRCKDYPKK